MKTIPPAHQHPHRYGRASAAAFDGSGFALESQRPPRFPQDALSAGRLAKTMFSNPSCEIVDAQPGAFAVVEATGRRIGIVVCASSCATKLPLQAARAASGAVSTLTGAWMRMANVCGAATSKAASKSGMSQGTRMVMPQIRD